jgi:hypothetical protein
MTSKLNPGGREAIALAKEMGGNPYKKITK